MSGIDQALLFYFTPLGYSYSNVNVNVSNVNR